MNSSETGAEADSKLARAARSARRLAQLSQMPRGAETLDLFAEDTERVLFQATNTDLRQGTLAGFELPEAFMATVCATSGIDDPASATRPARSSTELDRDAPVQIDLPVDEGAVDDLPVRHDPPLETAAAEPVQGDTDPSSKLPEPEPTGADAVAPRPAQPASAAVRNVARKVAMPRSAAASPAGSKSWQSQPASLAAALIGTERSSAASNDATPELERARATAFADTIDALYAVIAEQRQGAARLSRRMNALLAFIGCVVAVTMAAGIAQTVALQRMNRENTLQQQRIEELLLNQQATLATLFDTDSANVAIPNAPAAPRVASSNAIADAGDTSKKHAARHAGKLH
jgi:uncharacterized coiled-coil protein SlyX